MFAVRVLRRWLKKMSELNNNKPLFWPIDWDDLTEAQRFFQNVPFFGIKAFVKRFLDKRMKCRTKEILYLWPDIQQVIYTRDIIIRFLIDYSFWEYPLFHPDDPCNIVFWKPDENLEIAEILTRISHQFSLPIHFFDDFNHKTLLQLVEDIASGANIHPGPK